MGSGASIEVQNSNVSSSTPLGQDKSDRRVVTLESAFYRLNTDSEYKAQLRQEAEKKTSVAPQKGLKGLNAWKTVLEALAQAQLPDTLVLPDCWRKASDDTLASPEDLKVAVGLKLKPLQLRRLIEALGGDPNIVRMYPLVSSRFLPPTATDATLRMKMASGDYFTIKALLEDNVEVVKHRIQLTDDYFRNKSLGLLHCGAELIDGTTLQANGIKDKAELTLVLRRGFDEHSNWKDLPKDVWGVLDTFPGERTKNEGFLCEWCKTLGVASFKEVQEHADHLSSFMRLDTESRHKLRAALHLPYDKGEDHGLRMLNVPEGVPNIGCQFTGPPPSKQVKAVEVCSWADKEGIGIGWRLVSVNGAKVKDLTQSQLKEYSAMRPLSLAFDPGEKAMRPLSPRSPTKAKSTTTFCNNADAAAGFKAADGWKEEEEKRVASDGRAYTRQQFIAFFGESAGVQQWSHARAPGEKSRKAEGLHECIAGQNVTSLGIAPMFLHYGQDRQVYVQEVLQGSWAQKCGIVTFMQIIKINGDDARTMEADAFKGKLVERPLNLVVTSVPQPPPPPPPLPSTEIAASTSPIAEPTPPPEPAELKSYVTNDGFSVHFAPENVKVLGVLFSAPPMHVKRVEHWAAKDGIQFGWRLVSVNDKQVESLTNEDMKEAMRARPLKLIFDTQAQYVNDELVFNPQAQYVNYDWLTQNTKVLAQTTLGSNYDGLTQTTLGYDGLTQTMMDPTRPLSRPESPRAEEMRVRPLSKLVFDPQAQYVSYGAYDGLTLTHAMDELKQTMNALEQKTTMGSNYDDTMMG